MISVCMFACACVRLHAVVLLAAWWSCSGSVSVCVLASEGHQYSLGPKLLTVETLEGLGVKAAVVLTGGVHVCRSLLPHLFCSVFFLLKGGLGLSSGILGWCL